MLTLECCAFSMCVTFFLASFCFKDTKTLKKHYIPVLTRDFCVWLKVQKSFLCRFVFSVKLHRVLSLSHSIKSSVHCGFLFLTSFLNFVSNDGDVLSTYIPTSRTRTLTAALSALTVDLRQLTGSKWSMGDSEATVRE